MTAQFSSGCPFSAYFYADPFITQSYFYSTLLWQIWGVLCATLFIPYSPMDFMRTYDMDLNVIGTDKSQAGVVQN